jgi:O-antigen/teichoic acid export membrane protein
VPSVQFVKFVSLSRSIASNTFISAIARIISIIFSLSVVGIVTRSLGQEGFGEYSTILAYLALFVIAADLGLQSLMTRELSQTNEGFSRIASNYFTLRCTASLIILGVGFVISFAFPYPTHVQIGIGIGAFGFLFLSFTQVLQGIFQKHLAMHLSAIGEVVGRAVQLAMVYVIFQNQVSLWMLLGIMSFASFLIFVLHYYFAQKYIKIRLRFEFRYWLEILKITWPIALSIVLTLVYFKIDTIFLSLMKDQRDVGIYNVAYRALESLLFFPAMFSGIMMPILSREAIMDKEQFRQTLNKSLRVISIFTFPIVCGGIILSYSITTLIGGADFWVSGKPMQILFIACGIIFYGNLLGRAIIALDLQKKAVLVYLIGMLLNVVLNLIYIPQYSYIGAAWTTVGTEALIGIFLFWILWKKTRVEIDFYNLSKIILATGIMGLFLFVLSSPLTQPLSLIKLGIYTLFGAITYFISLYIIKGISSQEMLSFLPRRK